jgi:hypothetical protein
MSDGIGTMVLFAEKQLREVLRQARPGALLLTVSPGLGGAWTELHGGQELIRFGFPPESTNPWFQVLHDPGKKHNALTLALERIIFARRINMIAVTDPSMERIARRGAAVHPATMIQLLREQESLADFLAYVMERARP